MLSLPSCHCQGPSCLSPKRRVLPSPASYLPPAAGALVTEVVTWGTLPAVAAEAGAEVLFDRWALSLVLWCRRERMAFLTCAVADAVVLGSEAFHFFVAFITFLFLLSSHGISQFRKEESVPRRPYGVTGMCMVCAGCCRAGRRRASYHDSLSWDPLLRGQVTAYLHGGCWVRADSFIGFLYCSGLFTVGTVAQQSLLKAVLCGRR